MTVDEARQKVEQELRRFGQRSGPEELVVIDEDTIERPWGWVFFYTSRGWRDGDSRYALGGNAPIIVNRFDGALRSTGTASSIDHYIAEYEAELERRQGTWQLIIQERNASPQTLSRIRHALRLSVAEAGTLKQTLPCVWKVGAKMDLEPVLDQLRADGISAEIRRSDRIY